MRILVTGATGFIGRALVQRLRRTGASVVAWARSRERARNRLGAAVDIVPVEVGDAALVEALSGVDGVVNLAGEPVLPRRWTVERQRELVQSRVGVTERLVAALALASPRPRVLVSASAVGYYGDTGSRECGETDSAGTGFLADLCVRWERAAVAARALSVRVVPVRIGIVLGLDGGALLGMLPLSRLAMGGPIGDGGQYVSWIHLDDLVELLLTALQDDRWVDVANGTAPFPVTNRALAQELEAAVGRRFWVKVPSLVVRLALGEAASVLLQGQRATPREPLRQRFVFRFPRIHEALADLVGHGSTVKIEPVPGVSSGSTYLRRWQPTHRLTQRTLVEAPLETVFSFFSRPENLGLVTPGWLDLEILEPRPETMETGTLFDYRIRVGPVPVGWITRIEEWRPPERFVDYQISGPYRCWYHEHLFVALGSRTLMEDRVHYAVPVGLVGKAMNAVAVAGMLRQIFGYRRDAIRRMFGVAPDPETR
ncbi:MAG: TIGR01777 family protein [Candidatus Riflebacteria bacterium]|nr:TIGR01777 family protein [Candidatus Riflebacteria bacterium]